MTNPRVTVIIPGSNRPEKLARAIASYHAQTLPAEQRQLLVTDSPLMWGQKFNELAGLARGEFLVYLCDDDWLEPNYLERVLAVADGGADVVYTDRIDHGGRPGNPDGRYTAPRPLTSESFAITNPLLGLTFLIQRELFFRAERWDLDSFPMLFDWALAYRAWRLGAVFSYCESTAWHYEWHGANGTLGFNYSEQYTRFLSHFPELRYDPTRQG